MGDSTRSGSPGTNLARSVSCALPGADGDTCGPKPDPGAAGNGRRGPVLLAGLMMYTGPVLKKIYVLYSASGYGTGQMDRWVMYDDTYTGN